MNRERLVPALIVATALGVGLLVLQRWVAETKTAAIVLVSIWFALVGIAALVATSRRPELRAPVLGTYVAILIATVAIGYWTGFRDTEVDEDVVVATAEASGSERDAALAGNGEAAEPEDADAKDQKPEPRSPPARSRSPWASSPARTATPAPGPQRSVKEHERRADAHLHRLRRRSGRRGRGLADPGRVELRRPRRARRPQGQRRRPAVRASGRRRSHPLRHGRPLLHPVHGPDRSRAP